MIDSLEDRTLLSGFSELGTTLSIDVQSGETVQVVSNGATYTLTSSATWTGSDSANVTGNGTSFLTVTAAGLTAFDTISIGDSGAGAAVTFNTGGANTYSDSINVTLDDGLAGTITFNGSSSWSGAAAINASTARNIVLNSGSSLSAVDGGITLTANDSGTATGNFAGVLLDVATITTSGIGNIALTGKGGLAVETDNYGIQLLTGSAIQSTKSGLAANQGTITLNGAAGGAPGSSGNIGVFLTGTSVAGSVLVSSVDGDISIIGTARNDVTGSGNTGVLFEQGTSILSSGAAKITIQGNGGGTGVNSHENHGVKSQGASASISIRSVIGDISITGVGGANGSSANTGVNMAGTIESTGSAKITISGTGSSAFAGGSNNFGVILPDVKSVDGDISIQGQGSVIGSQNGNIGVQIRNVSGVLSTGAADIQITGTAGGGNTIGVDVTGTVESQATGSITIIGTGTTTAPVTGNEGISIRSPSTGLGQIKSPGTGNVTLIADSMNFGENTAVAAGSNSVTLRQKTNGLAINLGGDDSAAELGPSEFGPTELGLTDAELDRITAGSVQIGDTNSGAITVSAAIDHGNNLSLTTGAGITINQAVTMAMDKSLSATTTSTAAGINLATSNSDIATSGTGTVLLSAAREIGLAIGSSITTVNGGITLTANSLGTASDAIVGITLDGATITTSGTGNLSLSGKGGLSAAFGMHGILLLANSKIQSTGSGLAANQGTISIDGKAGGVDTNGNGVFTFGNPASDSVLITSVDGDISITGTAQNTSTGSNNNGVYFDQGTTISSSGNAKIMINGTGGGMGNTSTTNYGVTMTGLLPRIATVTGDISIIANGGTQAFGGNTGFNLNSGIILSEGSAKISITGTGGSAFASGFNNAGVALGSSTVVRSMDGDVTIIGQGSVNGAMLNQGILQLGNVISDGAAKIQLEGTGGGGEMSQGISFSLSGNVRSMSTGSITIIGASGTSGVVNESEGISFLLNSRIDSSGSGTVTLISDSQRFDNTSSINAGSNRVTLKQKSTGGSVMINLGAADTTGILGLTDAELDVITAGTLTIGDAQSGAITSSEDIDLTDGPAISTLHFNSSQSVDNQGGFLAVTNLVVEAGASIRLGRFEAAVNEPISVVNVAATTSGAGAIFLRDTDGFTVTTVDGVAGVRAANGSAGLTAVTGDITITNTSADDDFFGTGGVSVELQGTNAKLTTEAGSNIKGPATTLAADKMVLLGTVQASGETFVRPGTNGTAINLGSTIDTTNNTLELSDAELDLITTGTLAIGNANSGAIVVSSSVGLANAPTLHLTGASLNPGVGGNLTVPNLAISTTSGVGTTGTLLARVTNLAVQNSGTGVVAIERDNGSVTIGTVNGVVGASTAQGNSLSIAGRTAVIVNAAVSAPQGSVGFAVRDDAGLLTINAPVAAGFGDSEFAATRMHIGANVTVTGGSLALNAQRSNTAHAVDLGSVTDSAVNTLELSDAELDRISAGLLIIGRITSGPIVFSSDIDLTDTPAIARLNLDTNSLITATAGGIKVGDLSIRAAGSVSITDPQTDFTNVAIETSSGAVTLTESNGFTVRQVSQVDGISTGSGAVALTATTGNISVSTPSSASPLGIDATGTISITLNGPDALFSSSNFTHLTSTAGSVTVTADNMQLEGTISAAGQTVALQPITAGRAIDLGSMSDAASDTLELSDVELDRITADTLEIGDDASGSIGISAVISPASYLTLDLQSNTTFAATGGFASDISSAEVFERILVTGSVTISDGATLSVSAVGGFVPAPEDTFLLIDNDEADAITGLFAGNPQGTVISLNGIPKTVSYLGTNGEGNDLALTGELVAGIVISDGTVTISNIGSTENESVGLALSADGQTLVVTVEGLTARIPLEDLVNLIFNGGTGDDTLTLDFTNGSPVPIGGLVFNGGVGGNDKLAVIGDGVDDSANYTPGSATGSGTLNLNAGGGVRSVAFTGLEPVDITGVPSVTVSGSSGADQFTLSLGFDATMGGVNPAVIVSGKRNGVTIESAHIWNVGTLTIDTGAGSDVINASVSTLAVTLIGGAGNDTLTGSTLGDSLDGGAGSDSLTAGGGDDTLMGGAGNDLLDGGTGTDMLRESANANFTLLNAQLTGNGTDKLSNIERAMLTGGSGNNLLDASAFTLGNVTLLGGAGNDTLLGSAFTGAADDGFNDSLDGGAGIDVGRQSSRTSQTLAAGPTPSTNVVTGASSVFGDLWASIEGLHFIGTGSAATTLDASAFAGSATLIGGSGNDVLTGGRGHNSLNGNAGHDVLTGGDAADTLSGGAGNDSLVGNDGNDVLNGQAGNDTLRGNSGDDRMFGDVGSDKLFGGNGQDLLDGGEGGDVLTGEVGDDTINGGAGHDAISGGDGNDVLNGGLGNDTILGGTGNDALRSDGGADRLFGGSGDDRFVASSSRINLGGGDDTISGSNNVIDAVFVFDFEKLLLL